MAASSVFAALSAALAAGCSNDTESPPFLGDTTAPSSSSTGTGSAPDGGTPISTDASSDADAGACQSIDALIASYGLVPTCDPCIDKSCTTQIVACNADCSCPAAVVGYVQCVSFGANPTTCAANASAATNPQLAESIFSCAVTCKDDCAFLDGGTSDAGDGGSNGDGGDGG